MTKNLQTICGYVVFEYCFCCHFSIHIFISFIGIFNISNVIEVETGGPSDARCLIGKIAGE